MGRTMRSVAAVVLTAWIGGALAGEGGAKASGEEVVARLGELNGMALACGAAELVPRTKGAMIHYVPKTRDMGKVFEDATDRAYMAHMKGKAECLPPPHLRKRIEIEVEALKTIYPRAE